MTSVTDSYEDEFETESAAQPVEMKIWRRLFGYALVYPRELCYLAAFAFLTACVEVIYPLITRGVVDAVSESGMDAELGWYGAAYLACTLTLGLCIGGFIWMAGKIRTHISHDIRRDGFHNLQALSFSFYDQRPVGWLMARMTSDCDRLANILAWGFMDLVWGATMMTGVALAMLVMNTRLALIVLSILPVLWLVSKTFQVRILDSARAVRRTNSQITAAYNESITGMSTSKAFVREAENLSGFRDLTDGMFAASVRNHIQAAVYVPLVMTLASLATGAALAVGGFELLEDVITVGTLIAFLAYTRHFFEPVEQLGEWFAEMQMAQASAERVLRLIDTVPDVRDGDSLSSPKATIEEIRLQEVEFHYGDGHPVLQDINFSISQGQTIALVGPTGGGKSTLVNLICRFYEPTAGHVFIDGTDYRDIPQSWLQSRLGVVLQEAYLFSGTIFENIQYGNLKATEEQVLTAARLAGVDQFAATMDHGIHTEIGEGGNRLSAGQKQLVSIARAMLADPEVLIMDEATSSVDTVTEQTVQRGLDYLLQDRLSVVIAHRLSTIRNADQILLIQEGRLVERGTHDQLLALEGRYYTLYQDQGLDLVNPDSHWSDNA